jgi:2-polyprenyl-3-methyl-5-hydroxy-6-metoxy-1,4-benzoquinol methylase
MQVLSRSRGHLMPPESRTAFQPPTLRDVPDAMNQPRGGDTKSVIEDGRTRELRSCLSEQEIHEWWETDYLNADLNRFYDQVFDRIIQTLAPKSGQTLLDAGCGYGFHAVRLARSGVQVTGVDFSEVALRHSAATIERAGLSERIRVQQGDLLDLPFLNGTFDYVHCWGVLMHVPQIDAALTELIRVLKPGGKLVLMENNASSLHVHTKSLARLVKRLFGRPNKERTLTPWGCEEWELKGTHRLMVRASNVDFLVRFCAERGLRLTDRFAGQFTELYATLPGRFLKRATYKLNELWFRSVRRPALALGNILVFQKK